MTEKRFYVAESNLIDGYCVFDREKKYAFTPRPRKADCLNDAHTLNELSEENEQLKQENNLKGDFRGFITKDIQKTKEENEHLKEALTELKEIGDYQADRIKELQGFEDVVFNLLNDKIKRGEEAIEWGESIGADVGAMGFHIELLKQFKKELSE